MPALRSAFASPSLRVRTLAAALAAALAWPSHAQLPLDARSVPRPAWVLQLETDLRAIPVRPGVHLGVHVHDLASHAVAGLRDEERWYLASLVKLPVAIAVLRGVQENRFQLDTPLRLRADDRVDGAGHTNAQPVAAPLTVRYLLEQMMSFSDNTASDMLIALVGLDAVNATVDALVPGAFDPITTLADVRRAIYGQLTPQAARLRGSDLLRLHAQPDDAARLRLLARLLDIAPAEFRVRTLDAAYAAYYRAGLNTAPLEAYGRLLVALVEGRALDAQRTAWLLALMERTHTGAQRIKAGLPAEVVFAHKTGTQRARTCDAGIVRPAASTHAAGLVVVACVRGEKSLPHAEAALREVGRTVCRATASRNQHHADACPLPAPAAAADPAPAAGRGAAGRRG
jgi:beta-lactamase class A